MKGRYYCELYDGQRRRSLCLRTDSYELACQRYAGGLKELRKKIRAEHDAAKPQERLAWLPEEIDAIKETYKDSDFTAHDIAREALKVRDWEDPRIEELAEHIAGVAPVTWEMLRANAVTVRKRKHGKDYSPSWHRNIETLLKTVDFLPTGLTPQRIRRWMDEQEREGMDSVTLKNRLSALQGLVERAITSGYQPQLAPNVFKQVDFSISKEKEQQNTYYCPTPEDYRKLFTEVLPEQPERIAVGIELMAWTGCRVSALPYLSSSAEPGWLDVPDVPGTKGGGRVPVPMMLWQRGRDLKISVRKLNGVLKDVHPELVNHSLRSGFKMLSRLAGIDSQLGESLLMHKLQALEAVYGGPTYPDEAKLKGSKQVWAELETILETTNRTKNTPN